MTMNGWRALATMLVVIVATSTLGVAGRTGPSTGTQDADDEEVESHTRALN